MGTPRPTAAAEVASDRRYRFPVGRDALWAAMTDVGSYRAWWPWLASFDGQAFEPGVRWACVVQPPLPYTVRFTVHLDEVEPASRVRATVSGDVEGTAELRLADGPTGGSEAWLRSRLAPAHPLLQTVARLARPVVRFGHDWVLDTGARQFGRDL